MKTLSTETTTERGGDMSVAGCSGAVLTTPGITAGRMGEVGAITGTGPTLGKCVPATREPEPCGRRAP
jgi:hypothetical protein